MSKYLFFIVAVLSLPLIWGCSSSKGTAKLPTSQYGKSPKSSGSSTGKLKDDRVEKPSSNSSLAKACAKLGVPQSKVKNKDLYIVSAQWIGTSYKYGGMSSSGVDCSGLTNIIVKKVYGKGLSRSSAGIYSNDVNKISKSKIQEGDLVFFRTDGKKSSTPNHVGIYLNDDKFIHASTSKGVIVSSMSQQYYVTNYIGAGRLR